MPRKDEILNYFQHGNTNAKAEQLNSKMNRFVANNHSIKDKDFALSRIANYFKYHLKLFENLFYRLCIFGKFYVYLQNE